MVEIKAGMRVILPQPKKNLKPPEGMSLSSWWKHVKTAKVWGIVYKFQPQIKPKAVLGENEVSVPGLEQCAL